MSLLKESFPARFLFNIIIGLINKSRIFSSSYIRGKVFLEGCNLISAHCTIEKCSFGFSSYVGNGVNLFNVKIGKYTSIGPNVTNIVGRHPTRAFVSTHPAFFSLMKQVGYTYVEYQHFNEYKYANSDGNSVEIGNDVWIGANVVILDGVTIGDGAIIGAGCVVSKSVKPYEICIGNPQRILRKRFSDEEISKLISIKWWDKDPSWLKNNNTLFSDVKRFLNEINI
jgi:acetyltransferase-like isoleucine patch superfamily enzyme